MNVICKKHGETLAINIDTTLVMCQKCFYDCIEGTPIVDTEDKKLGVVSVGKDLKIYIRRDEGVTHAENP